MAVHVEEIVLKLKDKFTKTMGGAERSTEKVRGKARNLDGQLKKLQGTAVKAFGAFAVFSAVKGIANLGIEMEQTRVAFSTFLGDADKANATIKELNEFSNVTPFTNDQVIKAGKSLLAFGTPVENLKKQLKSIGDISAGTGKDFNELTTIYGKAQIAGTLYAEDINQLVEAGIPIIGEFAKQLGVPEGEIKKLASQGKIGFGELQTAFQNLTGDGGMFFDLMEKQSKTVGGQISTLKGKLGDVGVTLGEALLPVLQDMIVHISALTEWISKNKDAIAAWVPFIAKTVGVILAIVAAIKIWMGVQTMINFLLTANPIGLIIVGIAALIALIAVIIVKYDEWGATMALLMGPLGLVINLIQSFRRNWDAIKKAFTDGGIMAGLKKIGAVIIDALLMPVQQLLELASNIPGLGKLAGKGAAKIESIRRGLGVEMNDGPIGPPAPESESKTDENGVTKKLPLAPIKPIIDATKEAKGGLSGGLSGVASSAPKNITISINKLVENLNVNTTNLKEGTAEIREEITKALMMAINDSQIISN